MTISEFAIQREVRPCEPCGQLGVETELNPNNNGLLVRCPHCGSNRPWGSLLYLKQNERRRARRPPLPDGVTLEGVWAQFGNRCTVCGAPKEFLQRLGIGLQVHHVAPYAQEGHRGPLVPICTHCHPTVTERQRLYWFFHRVILANVGEEPEEPNVTSGEPAPPLFR
jgi:hypothetical protein